MVNKMDNKIVVNGKTYVLETDETQMPYQIVVIEGRWNVVGYVKTLPNKSIVITEAKVIRYWGTTKGLGELAFNGPTSKTILDVYGTVRVPSYAILMLIDTVSDKWN